LVLQSYRSKAVLSKNRRIEESKNQRIEELKIRGVEWGAGTPYYSLSQIGR